MHTFSRFNRKVLVASLLTVSVASAAFADGTDTKETDTKESLATQVQDLKTQLAQLEAKVKANDDENWLTAARTAQIENLVKQTLADAQKRGQFADGPDFGYHNGFFIQTPDQKFKLSINGYVQFRYVFANDTVKNRSAFSKTPANGDENEFGFRRARLIFSGNAFDPKLIYMLSGDFGNSAGNSGNFQILDAFVGYNFSPMLKLKGGAMLVPFTYAEAYSSGISEPEFATTSVPFDAVRTLGVSLYGDLIHDKLNYELQINDGSKANALGRPGDTGGKLNNRMGFYGRMEWAGNGSLSEMHSESDVKGAKDFIWLLGGAAGYEEQNAQSNAFPASQNSLVLSGLSSDTSPGFAASQTVNGSIFRATMDFHAKYRGFSVGAAAYLQYLNDELPAGSSTDSFRTMFGTSSLAEMGYTIQAGYFFVPHKWEAVARMGQLMTCGLPNRMEEYTLGLNYYLYGQNAKLQLAETYIPNEAAFSDSGANTAINTQDLITQLQFQLKF